MLDKRFRWASDGRIVLLVVLIGLRVFNLVSCAAVVSTIVSLFLFSMVTLFQSWMPGGCVHHRTFFPSLYAFSFVCLCHKNPPHPTSIVLVLLPYWTCYGFRHLGHSISPVVTDCPHSM
ncbi:hypothetical protein ARMGADRAFT_816755 [Armillaria gallica]|uniref:Uncharacterized protein n=1 Tax=Armillaria gallica TaxID=47427 RepID=A0A2H3CRI5_ARMGA|nr:hypothetical protein ARMGADRAFT_816755 [Armillaria gallica]